MRWLHVDLLRVEVIAAGVDVVPWVINHSEYGDE